MTSMVAEGAMREGLESATEPIEILNSEGRTLGVFQPMKYPRSPFSREEIEQRRADYRRNGQGKQLSQIFNELVEKHGE
jgi:hypothetical protein